MKKTIRIMAVVMAVLMVTLVLASCGGGLSGKYSAEAYGSTITFEFKGNNVTYTMSAAGQEIFSLEGTYEIKGDKISFDFTADDTSIAAEMIDEMTNLDFEKGDGYIVVDGLKMEKK